MTLDDLEFELRKLPGVRAAGFDDRGDVLMVQLHLAPNGGRGDEPELPLPVAATRIAARHSDKPVAVEVVRWRQAPPGGASAASAPPASVTPLAPAPAAAEAPPAAAPPVSTAAPASEPSPRPRLLAVLSFPDTDEVEVHLVLHGRRTIGRSAASGGLAAVVTATLDALRAFSLDLPMQPMWAREVDDTEGERHLVAIGVAESDGTKQLFGLAAGTSAIDAAARATLDALNRRIERALGS